MQGSADENGGAGEHGGADKAVNVIDAVMFGCAGFIRMSCKPGLVALSDAVFQHISGCTQIGQTGLDFRHDHTLSNCAHSGGGR